MSTLESICPKFVVKKYTILLSSEEFAHVTLPRRYDLLRELTQSGLIL